MAVAYAQNDLANARLLFGTWKAIWLRKEGVFFDPNDTEVLEWWPVQKPLSVNYSVRHPLQEAPSPSSGASGDEASEEPPQETRQERLLRERLVRRHDRNLWPQEK